jgi:hypothetical protein
MTSDLLPRRDLPSVGGNSDALSRALLERYRCPRNFFNFDLRGPLSSEETYFRFGPDTPCFGRTRIGAPSAGYDALSDVQVHDGRVNVPFDPGDIIDNLRLERYEIHGAQGDEFLYSTLRRLYYLVRPLTTLALRKQIQKFHARSGRMRTFPKWPVDSSVEDMSERLLLLSMEANGVDKVPIVWFWPDGAKSCLMMTHDVEYAAGRDHCAELMELDNSFGIKASFEIVPEERYSVPESFLASLRERGFEIVIQDLNHDGRLFDDKEEFLRRAKIINRYAQRYGARGFRAAVLYRRPEWYKVFEFAFDMSIPNVAHLDPQRGGCCTVMPYFIGEILELPVTTVQDYTLFHILNEYSINLWKTQLNRIIAKNGLASFIVHPDYVIEPEARRVYLELLGHLRELRRQAGLWCALPSEVEIWWRNRSKMSLVADGSGWRIEGKGSERAVVAYAKRVDGNLIYEVAGPQ